MRGDDNFCAFFQSIYKSNSKLNDYEDCTTYTPVAGYLGELYYAELVLRLVLPMPRVPASPTAAPSPPPSPPPPPPLTPRTGAASRRWCVVHRGMPRQAYPEASLEATGSTCNQLIIYALSLNSLFAATECQASHRRMSLVARLAWDVAARGYFTYFLTITVALWPPKPKELERAARTVRCCAWPKVKLRL